MTLPLVLCLIVAHEGAHWLTGRLLGLPARFGYTLRPFPYPVVRMPVTNRRDTALIALAGPVFNLALAWPLWVAGQPLAGIVSGLFGAVSFIPVRPQDGWHILNAWKATK